MVFCMIYFSLITFLNQRFTSFQFKLLFSINSKLMEMKTPSKRKAKSLRYNFALQIADYPLEGDWFRNKFKIKTQLWVWFPVRLRLKINETSETGSIYYILFTCWCFHSSFIFFVSCRFRRTWAFIQHNVIKTCFS